MRRGCWVLLEAFMSHDVPAAAATCNTKSKTTSGVYGLDPLFVVGCWGRVRCRMLRAREQGGGAASTAAAEDAEADGRYVPCLYACARYNDVC